MSSHRNLRASARLTFAALVVATIAGVAPAGAAEGGGCRLTATATFTPGISLTDQAMAYSLSGSLTMCGGSPGTPASGDITFGGVWTEPGTGYKWREPAGTANGSCASTTTSATSIVRWSDGTVTIVDFDTASVLPVVSTLGSVLPSVTLAAVDQVPGQPATKTIQTTRLSAALQTGLLFAMPSDAGLSCGAGGLVTVPLDGAVTSGTAS